MQEVVLDMIEVDERLIVWVMESIYLAVLSVSQRGIL